MYKVLLGQGMGKGSHWALLKRRLESICPGAEGPGFGRDWEARSRATQPHLLEISCYDRRGCLHGAASPSLPPLLLSKPRKGKWERNIDFSEEKGETWGLDGSLAW